MKPEIIIIAALSKNRVIGKDGKIPWRIPEDLKRFKELTIPHPIVMGRKTHESIGKALPGRTNIIITHDPNYLAVGCMVVHSLEEALRQAQGDDETFVIGGGQIYNQSIGLASRLYLTVVKGSFEGDTCFPDYSEFRKVVSCQEGESGKYKYKFLELER